MREPRAHLALRYGFVSAVAIAAIVGADAAIQALRHAIGPSARGLVVFNYLALLLTLALVLAASYRATRPTGRARSGLLAGAMSAGLPFALLMAVAGWSSFGGEATPVGMRIGVYVTAILMLGAGAGLAGAMIGVPAALIGRARYRSEHAAEWAALAAEREAHAGAERSTEETTRAREEARRKRKRNAKANLLGVLLAAALFAMMIIATLAAQWVFEVMPWRWALACAGGALALSLLVLRVAPKRHWTGYLVDWLGVTGLVSAVIVGLAETTGQSTSMVGGLGTLIFIWRGFDRAMRGVLPVPVELPERAPVTFRDDGERIVVYPSRRGLIKHALFCASVLVGGGALAYLLRDGGLTPVLGFGAFALAGLIGLWADLKRLLRWRPTLIVTAAGIADAPSSRLFGFGLIPWHEISGVVNWGRLRGGRYPELAILPVSYARLVRRKPCLKRPWLRLRSLSLTGGNAIYVSSLFLSESPAELAKRINVYVESHAPADFFAEEEAEDVEG